MKSFQNIHLYPTAFTNETRILRVTKTLSEQGIFSSILIVASFLDNKTAFEEDIDNNRTVLRLKATIKGRGFITKIFYFIEWYIKALLKINGKDLVCVNAHSLSVLPMGLILKVFYKATLIYDAHEIETETQEIKGSRRIFSKLIERLFISFVDKVILTSEGHEKWYKEKYKNLDVDVVRNCPYKRDGVVKGRKFRDRFSIPDDEIIYIYQGYLSTPRGVNLILETFKRIDKKKHIVFMGFGDLKREIIQCSLKYKNIHFHEAVIPDLVFEYTKCAEVGIHMMDDSCKNHLYALPNKPMEYMNAGLPCIVSDLPTMGSQIREANSGWLLPPNDAEALELLVKKIDNVVIKEKSVHALEWSHLNNWEAEEAKLLSIYSKLGYK